MRRICAPDIEGADKAHLCTLHHGGLPKQYKTVSPVLTETQVTHFQDVFMSNVSCSGLYHLRPWVGIIRSISLSLSLYHEFHGSSFPHPNRREPPQHLCFYR